MFPQKDKTLLHVLPKTQFKYASSLSTFNATWRLDTYLVHPLKNPSWPLNLVLIFVLNSTHGYS